MEFSGDEGDIAIIGMAGRFPGACNVGELWRNLREGVEGDLLRDPALRQIADASRRTGVVQEVREYFANAWRNVLSIVW